MLHDGNRCCICFVSGERGEKKIQTTGECLCSMLLSDARFKDLIYDLFSPWYLLSQTCKCCVGCY